MTVSPSVPSLAHTGKPTVRSETSGRCRSHRAVPALAPPPPTRCSGSGSAPRPSPDFRVGASVTNFSVREAFCGKEATVSRDARLTYTTERKRACASLLKGRGGQGNRWRKESVLIDKCSECFYSWNKRIGCLRFQNQPILHLVRYP